MALLWQPCLNILPTKTSPIQPLCETSLCTMDRPGETQASWAAWASNQTGHKGLDGDALVMGWIMRHWASAHLLMLAGIPGKCSNSLSGLMFGCLWGVSGKICNFCHHEVLQSFHFWAISWNIHPFEKNSTDDEMFYPGNLSWWGWVIVQAIVHVLQARLMWVSLLFLRSFNLVSKITNASTTSTGRVWPRIVGELLGGLQVSTSSVVPSSCVAPELSHERCPNYILPGPGKASI